MIICTLAFCLVHIPRTGFIRRTQGKIEAVDRLLSESHVYLTNFKCILKIGELNSFAWEKIQHSLFHDVRGGLMVSELDSRAFRVSNLMTTITAFTCQS